MKKLVIFNDIVQIMHHDYAGCIDKIGVDSPGKYRSYLLNNPEIGDSQFLELVRDYLVDFQDQHIIFSQKEQVNLSNGFTVRRYGKKLFVTKTMQEINLQAGDAIVAINGKSIAECEQLYARYLCNDSHERQDWRAIIRKAASCTIESADGEVREFSLKKYPIARLPARYEYQKLHTHTGILSLSDFVNEGAIRKLLDYHAADIKMRDNLIIDVRENDGGNDTAFLPLLDYVFAENCRYSQLQRDEMLSVNYTERNCRNRLAEFHAYLQWELDDFTSNYLKRAILHYERNRGKGFAPNMDGVDFEIKGQVNPKKVFVLSDVNCRSSGEAFVAVCKRSPKVTVIGRNTLGVTDYSNLAREDYGDFQLLYPTSRTNLIEYGMGINGKGVDVDVHIPWTPRHLAEDVDLRYVVDYI